MFLGREGEFVRETGRHFCPGWQGVKFSEGNFKRKEWVYSYSVQLLLLAVQAEITLTTERKLGGGALNF
jgi:hypothetical protein